MEKMYKEYKLETILNVITGINGLSDWTEVKELVEFLEGKSVADYQMMSAINNARNKILFKNRQFVELDVIGVKAELAQAEDIMLFLERWKRKQERKYGVNFRIYYNGKLEAIQNAYDTYNAFDEVEEIIEPPLQLVKKPDFSKVSV